MGIDTEVHRANDVRDVGPFDAIILGSAVYNRRWLRAAVRFGRRHGKETSGKKPVWLFESGPIGSPQPRSFLPAKDGGPIAARMGTVGPVAFSGRLRPEDVGRFARRRAQKTGGTGTPNIFGDWRSFEGVRRWARRIGEDLQAARAAAPEADSLLEGLGVVNRQRMPEVRYRASFPTEAEGAGSSRRSWGSAPRLAAPRSSVKPETVVTEMERDSDVFLVTGESVIVRLMESPQYGFRWTIDTVDPAVLYLRSDGYIDDPDSIVEGEVLRNFEFVAGRHGKCKLTLKLWDESIGEESVEDHFEVTVHVSER